MSNATKGEVVNGVVLGGQNPDDVSGTKYGGKWLGNDGRGGTNKDGFTWGLENPEAGKDRRKVNRARRSAEKWFAHKETAEQNKRRRIDYKATLDEWCKENDKPAPSVKAIPQIGGMSKAFVAVVTIGEETYEGPRALHEETAKRGAYTKALDTLGVSYAAPEPAVKEGAGTDAASPVLKNDGGFMARFKALKEKKEKEAETAAANNDPVSLGEKMRAGMAGMEKPDDSDEKEKEGGRGNGNRKRGR